MNNKQKKALYESIMKNVSKLVKKTLNESNGSETAEEYAMDFIQRLESFDGQEARELKEDVLLVINGLSEILKPVLIYDFENNSDEEIAVLEFDLTVKRLREML